MDDIQLLAGRVRELSGKAYQNDYLTHTAFLSASEVTTFYDILRKQGVSPTAKSVGGVPYVLWGGWEDAERQTVSFLPSYYDEASFLEGENTDPQVVSCILAEPVNRKFADALTHRDFLGALMNLGIERDQIGDILTDSTCAYIFVMKDIAEYVCRELIKVKHTMLNCREIAPGACTIRPAFEEIEGSVSSERLDAILAMVYHLSRGKAQELVEAEMVAVDGRAAFSGGYDLKVGARVSVRGHGKFIYEGQTATTKKGRLYVKVKKYV